MTNNFVKAIKAEKVDAFIKGGKGSGHFGHAGRDAENLRGGSAPSSGDKLSSENLKDTGKPITKTTVLEGKHIYIHNGEYKGKSAVVKSQIKRFRAGDNKPTYRIQVDGFPKPGGWNGEGFMTIDQLISSAVLID